MTKYIPDLPLPPGITTTAEFADRVGWGQRDQQARERAESITLEEIRTVGITLRIAKEWLEFYESVLDTNPTNPSVRGRIDLMTRIIELLR